MNNKNIFLSYSHSDKHIAQSVAAELQKNGIEVWYDKWEIKPGDSLIQKIFTEGLSKCDYFLILLSQNSLKSRWVQEELDSALVKKIEGVTRVIPILLEKIEIPASIRSLLWIDLSINYNENIRLLLKTIHGVNDKPPVGAVPDYVKELHQSVGGLSREASTIGLLFLEYQDFESGYERSFTGQDIKKILPALSERDINDAADELVENGFARVRKYLGTHPFEFGEIEPTYALFIHFEKAEIINYNPTEDIKSVASAVAAKDKITNKDLFSLTNLPPTRLNRAVSYLEDYGIIQIFKYMGTAPYSFSSVWATRSTRQFVKENCT